MEEQLGIRRAAQSIIYGGRLLRSEELVGDVLHDGAVIFVQVDTTPAPPPTHSPCGLHHSRTLNLVPQFTPHPARVD